MVFHRLETEVSKMNFIVDLFYLGPALLCDGVCQRWGPHVPGTDQYKSLKYFYFILHIVHVYISI